MSSHSDNAAFDLRVRRQQISAVSIALQIAAAYLANRAPHIFDHREQAFAHCPLLACFRPHRGALPQRGPTTIWHRAQAARFGGDYIWYHALTLQHRKFCISLKLHADCRDEGTNRPGLFEYLARSASCQKRLHAGVPPAIIDYTWHLFSPGTGFLKLISMRNSQTRAVSGDISGTDKIAMWMLDADYDGRSLFPRQVFFIADVLRPYFMTSAIKKT